MFKMFKILICFLKKILVGFGLNFLDFVKCKRKRKRRKERFTWQFAMSRCHCNVSAIKNSSPVGRNSLSCSFSLVTCVRHLARLSSSAWNLAETRVIVRLLRFASFRARFPIPFAVFLLSSSFSISFQ